MFIVRFILERLLHFAFVMARSAFIAQAVAMGLTVVLAIPFMNQSGSPIWLDSALSKGALMAMISLATGIALLVAWRMVPMRRTAPERFETELPAEALTLDDLPSPHPSEPHLSPWIVPFLGFSLAALPAITFLQSAALFDLWSDVWHLLDRLDIHKAFRGADPFSGLILGPIFVLLYVPALEVAAAFFLIAVPLALLALFLTRSHHFPRLFIMLVTCQAGLVLTCALGSSLFAQLASEGKTALLATGDLEGRQIAEALSRMQLVITSTATAFFLPFLGFCAWIPAMFSSRRVDAFFTGGAQAPLAAEPDAGA